MSRFDAPRRRFFGKALLGYVTVGVALVATACTTDNGGTTKDGIQLMEQDTLTVCVHLPAKPFEFQKSKKVVGFNVDLMDRFAEELGVTPKYININEWNQVTSGAVYKAGRCDLGMGGMTITPERDKALTLSQPYFDAKQGLLVGKDTPYRELADLKGKRVGVMTASTGAKYADDRADRLGFTPVKFTDLAIELNSFKAGNIDAVVHDNGPLYDYVNNNPDSHVVTEFDTGEQYAFSAKKDDANAEKLIKRLNEVLTKTEQDGTYDKAYEKWFKTAPPKRSK